MLNLVANPSKNIVGIVIIPDSFDELPVGTGEPIFYMKSWSLSRGRSVGWVETHKLKGAHLP